MVVPEGANGGVFLFEHIECQLDSTVVVTNTSNHLSSHALNKQLSLLKDLFTDAM